MSYLDHDAYKVDWITKCSNDYQNEKTLYSVMESEAYNKFGIQTLFYPVSINSDKVFGEDNNRVVQRSFQIMGYTEGGTLPYEGRNVSTMGIVSTDNFALHVSIRNFNYVSTFDSFGTSGVYPTYEPKIGDLLYFRYNNRFYRILMVKKEFEIFLQAKHTYTFIVEGFKDLSYNISQELIDANDPILTISSGTTSKDMFDLKNTIEIEKEKVLYKPANTECDPEDPFNNWVR